jgi:hypothetical protein
MSELGIGFVLFVFGCIICKFFSIKKERKKVSDLKGGLEFLAYWFLPCVICLAAITIGSQLAVKRKKLILIFSGRR